MTSSHGADDLVARARLLDLALAALERDPAAFDVADVAGAADVAGLGADDVAEHFAGPADFERALRARILEQIRAEIVPALSPDGTPREIIRRLVMA